EQNAVRLRDEVAEDLELIGTEAELLEVESEVRAVEDTHDDAFAEHRRERRDAQVDGISADVELDATVLRKARFGDVEVRHDLDPGDERTREVERRRHHLVEDAVDAVAHLELVLERLEVDVRRAVADRLEENHVEELDDRTGVSIRLELREVLLRARVEAIVASGGGEELVHAPLAFVIVLIDLREDQLLACDHRPEARDLRQAEAQVIEHAQVVGTRDRDREGHAVVVERHDPERLRGVAVDELEELLRDLHFLEIDELEARLLGERAAEVGIGDEAVRQKDLPDRAAALLLGLERLLDVVLGDETLLLEDLADRGVHGNVSCRRISGAGSRVGFFQRRVRRPGCA